MKKILTFCLAAALFCVIFSGCDATQTDRVSKSGSFSSTSSTKWNGRFKSYNGSESKVIRAKEGMDLVITFALSTEEGEFFLTVENQNGIVLNTRDEKTDEGTLSIGFEGSLRLRITGEHAKNGSFTLSWEFSPH